MATQTVTALFDRYEEAADAVRRIEAAGVPHGAISLVSNDASHSQYYGAVPGDADPMPDGQVSGTGAGASLGTLLGGGAGLLAGLGMLAIPGLGPVVAAGWLAATLVGAGLGAAAGGLVGSLTDIGVSETDAHAYAEGIHRGGTLLTVKAEPDVARRVGELLDRGGAVPMPEREGAWRDAGWGGRYVGEGAVTGAPVFSDPTMLGGGVPGTVPGSDAFARDGGQAVNEGRSGLPLAPSGGLTSPADDAGRGRVRIYDNG